MTKNILSDSIYLPQDNSNIAVAVVSSDGNIRLKQHPGKISLLKFAYNFKNLEPESQDHTIDSHFIYELWREINMDKHIETILERHKITIPDITPHTSITTNTIDINKDMPQFKNINILRDATFDESYLIDNIAFDSNQDIIMTFDITKKNSHNDFLKRFIDGIMNPSDFPKQYYQLNYHDKKSNQQVKLIDSIKPKMQITVNDKTKTYYHSSISDAIDMVSDYESFSNFELQRRDPFKVNKEINAADNLEFIVALLPGLLIFISFIMILAVGLS